MQKIKLSQNEIVSFATLIKDMPVILGVHAFNLNELIS